MKETIYLGSSPPEEDCAQVGQEGYHAQARKECRAYINQLYRFLASKGHVRNELPEGFILTTKSEPHDFGSYLEVVCKFNANHEGSWDLAQLLDCEGPGTWDQDAINEMNRPIA